MDVEEDKKEFRVNLFEKLLEQVKIKEIINLDENLDLNFGIERYSTYYSLTFSNGN